MPDVLQQKKRATDINELRWNLIQKKSEGKVSVKKKNIDLAKLPPLMRS